MILRAGGNANSPVGFLLATRAHEFIPSQRCVGRKQMCIFLLRYKQNRKQLLQQRRAVFPALYLCCSPLVAGLVRAFVYWSSQKIVRLVSSKLGIPIETMLGGCFFFLSFFSSKKGFPSFYFQLNVKCRVPFWAYSPRHCSS